MCYGWCFITKSFKSLNDVRKLFVVVSFRVLKILQIDYFRAITVGLVDFQLETANKYKYTLVLR